MNRPSLLPWILAIALFGAGCAPSPIAATGGKRPPKAGDVASPLPPTDTPTPVADPATAYRGTVLGLDGLPAANVTVRGHLISNNGSGLVSDRGSSIIGANGGSYRLLSETALEVQTDAEGRFSFQHPENQPLNLEAIAGPDLKAIRFNVAADATDVTLRLAPTGTISGHVTAPEAPGVTDFQGVDVYIPGTGYIAKTATSGAYTIPHVPVGSFTLVAEKAGLGSGTVTAVAVASKTTTTAPNLALKVQPPEIASVTPAHAAPGTELTISGQHFGQASGAVLEISIGGANATVHTRVDDETIKVTVPDSAGSDGIVVKVNQIASAVTPFKVLKTLTLAPETGYLIVGNQQQFTVTAQDTNGAAVADPLITWTAHGGVTVADGLVKAETVGSGAIEVSAGGKLKATRTFQIVGSVTDLPGHDALKDAGSLVTTPNGVFVMGYGALYQVNPLDGSISVFAGPEAADPAARYSFGEATSLTVDDAGAMYTVDGASLLKIGTNGATSVFTTVNVDLSSLTWAPDGSFYAVDWETDDLIRISAAGAVSVVAPGGNLDDFLNTIAVADDGTVYVAGSSFLYELTESGLVKLEDAQQQPFEFESITGFAIAPNGDLVVATEDGLNTAFQRIVPSTGAQTAMTFSPTVPMRYPGAMAFDAEGRLVIIDSDAGKVYRLTVD